MSDIYEIRVRGHLGQRWARYFEGMQIESLENGETRLCGQVADQAALHSLLARIWDLGLTLVLVRQHDHDAGSTSSEAPQFPGDH